MSERIISESWAILKPDGTVAEDWDSGAEFAGLTKDRAELLMRYRIPKSDNFRIARVKLVEIEEETK